MTMNLAERYNVRVEQAVPNATGFVWRAMRIEHVPASENGGRHHVYLDVLGRFGDDLRSDPAIQIVWGWVGQRVDEPSQPVRLEKKPPEHAANIPIEKGQRIWMRVDGYGYPSDIVRELHAMHPDEGPGATMGHHSFVVIFVLEATRKATPEAPTEWVDLYWNGAELCFDTEDGTTRKVALKM